MRNNTVAISSLLNRIKRLEETIDGLNARILELEMKTMPLQPWSPINPEQRTDWKKVQEDIENNLQKIIDKSKGFEQR